MTAPLNSPGNPIGDVAGLHRWFLETALPLWAQHGVDRAHGGFYEKLNHDLTPAEEPRRARLVARQIYVFATGTKLGWDGPGQDLAAHGLDFLTAHLISPEGRIAASCTPTGEAVDERQHLYDVAFVLFCLATIARVFPALAETRAVRALAARIAAQLSATKAHPMGGYIDEVETGLQCANPHMHLFEAFLAWALIAGPEERGFWQERADAIAALALSHMIQPGTGALPEHYDSDWRPVAVNGALIIEPGHQFEWSWLLSRWAHFTGRAEALAPAARLAEIGENHGIDETRDVAFHAIDDNLTPLDFIARLWPQTERMKAWHAQWLLAEGAQSADTFKTCRDRATRALGRYLDGPRPGLWYEVMDADGTFRQEPVKASSAYHIVCALETLFSDIVVEGCPA